MKISCTLFFLVILTSCQSSSTFSLRIDENNQPQVTYMEEVIIENMIVLGEHDCLGCLEFNRKGDGIIFKENQTQHQYQLDLAILDEGLARISITGDQEGEVYFGFSNIKNMQKGYLLLAGEEIGFQSFGEFSASLQAAKEGAFLFHLEDKYVGIRTEGKAGNQYGMFGFVLDELPGEVFMAVGQDSLQVIDLVNN